jgi:hypothetical protein
MNFNHEFRQESKEMNRNWTYALAIATFALVAGSSSAAGQVGLSVGGGPTIPLGALADDADMGFNIQASAALAPAMLPFGLRVDGAYNRFPDDHGHFRVISGTVNAVFNLPMQGLSPYIIGGLGVYNSQVEDDEDVGHDHAATNNLGANVGAGIRLGAGPLSLFVEGRLHNIFSEGEQARYLPVTIGVRF